MKKGLVLLLIIMSFSFAKKEKTINIPMKDTTKTFHSWQISLWNEYAIPSNEETDHIIGIRINPLFGKTKKLSGYDIGLGQIVTQEMVGLQEALLFNISNDTKGLQAAMFYCMECSLRQ